MGPTAGLDIPKSRKPAPAGNETQDLSARSLVTILTELLRLLFPSRYSKCPRVTYTLKNHPFQLFQAFYFQNHASLKSPFSYLGTRMLQATR